MMFLCQERAEGIKFDIIKFYKSYFRNIHKNKIKVTFKHIHN